MQLINIKVFIYMGTNLILSGIFSKKNENLTVVIKIL